MVIAEYARVSYDNKISETIENQFSIMDKFISSKPEFSGAEIRKFSDKESGINLDRSAFQEVLTKVRSREIDIIVVKDFSRLGRNYLDVCKLTESIFPFMGVRLISISENYDSSNKKLTAMDISVMFRAITDEFHSIETSEKVRKTFTIKMKNGEYLGATTPYGYILNDLKNPIIEPKTAEIVREIFQMRLDGLSTPKIAGELNYREIPSPKNGVWRESEISKILKNENYIGIKTYRKFIKDPKTKIKRPAEEHEKITLNAYFPPIIDVDVFEKVGKTFPPKERSPCKSITIMKGKLFCGTCNQTLRRDWNRVGYLCKNRDVSGIMPCFYGSIPMKILHKAVLEKVKPIIGVEIQNFKRFSFSNREKLDSELAELKEKRATIFEKYLENSISESKFSKEKSKISEKISELENQISEFQKHKAMRSQIGSSETPINTLKRLYKEEELTREHMLFVKKITVFDKENFEIELETDSPLTVLCRNIKIYSDI
jgi:DNA invertase Pin-like site-specific DNA recombinase